MFLLKRSVCIWPGSLFLPMKVVTCGNAWALRAGFKMTTNRSVQVAQHCLRNDCLYKNLFERLFMRIVFK